MAKSSKKVKNDEIRSFMSLFDIFAPKPFQDVYQLRFENERNGEVLSKTPCNKSDSRKLAKNKRTVSKTPYVTSEMYHALNKKTSDKSVVKSTSTLFYDLDKLIKRHSYHCVTQVKVLSDKVKDKFNENCFGRKSETIVQKCAAQIQPKLLTRDNFQLNSKKVKNNHLYHPKLSSEICLHDNLGGNYKAGLFVKREDNHQQKFWSYSKYQTEYSNPINKENKSKKKDRGKRIEDPCPCQLFSYACPCTDNKSLTNLAKSSKCLTVADQITSTAKLSPDGLQENKNSNCQNSKTDRNHENKLINTDNNNTTKKYGLALVSEEAVAQIINARLIPNCAEDSSDIINGTKVKLKSQQKLRQIFCPKCKEKIDIYSTNEAEDYLKSKTPVRQTSELKENINNQMDNDICNHSPPCELVPICQILPNDTYFSSKCIENVSTLKHNPKMIKITKACRHHPPCTVVPSCQKINVLKNNCEYIPPCLHRPRCVNLPLCIPISKTFYYDDILNKQTEEIDNITNFNEQYKYMSSHQHDSENNAAERQFNTAQKTCEYFSEYSPQFVLNPKTTCISPTFSPYIQMPMPCKCCTVNKSCQYDCIDCKCNPHSDTKEKTSVDAVVYIRDVGCQFRNKSFSPQDSLLYSKTSSNSFNLNTLNKTGQYYREYHTLRYEDKFTNPISGEELSMSTFTTSSLEIDIHCPSHGRPTNKGCTDFTPKTMASPFVAAFTTYTNQLFPYCVSASEENYHERNKCNNISHVATYSNKFRRSFLKGKRKKLFNVKGPKKSRLQSKVRLGCQSTS